MNRFSLLILLSISVVGVLGFSSPPKESESPSVTISEKPTKMNRYFTVETVIYPFEVALLLINDLEDGQKKSEWTIETFKEQATQYALLVPYFKQLEQAFPPLFRRVFSAVVLEMVAQKVPVSEVMTFVMQLGQPVDQQYVLEQLMMYLIAQGDITVVQNQMGQVTNQVVKDRLNGKLSEYYMAQGDENNATLYLDQIQSQNEKSNVYYDLAMALSKSSSPTKALTYVKYIQSPVLAQRAKRDVSISLAKHQAFDDAFKLLNLIETPVVYAQTLAQLSMSYATHRKFESAFQLAESIQDTYYQNMAYSHLAQTLSKQGDIKNAKLLLNELTLESFKAEAKITIAKSLADIKQNEEAVQFANQLSDQSKRQQLLLDLVNLFGYQDDYHYQLLLIKQFEPALFRHRARALFAESYALAHPIKRALPVLNDMPAEYRLEVMSRLATYYAKEQDLNNIFDLLSVVPSLDIKVDVLFVSVDHLNISMLSTPNIGQLSEMLLAITDDDLTVPSIIRRDLALAQLYYTLHDLEKVDRLLPRISDKLSLIQDPMIFDALLAQLITISAQMGYFEIAYSQLGVLTNPTDQIQLLLSLPLPPEALISKYEKVLNSLQPRP